jgi:hypothetical protein
MSDEAHFLLSTYINKQNFRYWNDKNPMQLYEKPVRSEEVGNSLVCCSHIWCNQALFVRGKEPGHYLDSERYFSML